MAKYRKALPQLSGGVFLSDGGIETTMIFHEGLDLPHFAAFHLLKDQKGEAALRKYFRTYAALARDYQVGSVLFSKRRRGGRAPIGSRSWVMPSARLPRSTANPLRCCTTFAASLKTTRRRW